MPGRHDSEHIDAVATIKTAMAGRGKAHHAAGQPEIGAVMLSR